jgi:hypothetical protein
LRSVTKQKLNNEELINYTLSNYYYYYYCNNIKENMVGGAGKTVERDDKCIYKFYSECLKRRDLLGDLGVYGRIILKWILKK